MSAFDTIVVGCGLRGLHTALRIQTQRLGVRILAIDREAWPGDDVRTQRSNGFMCEIGPAAFTAEDLAPHLELLQKPPRTVTALPEAGTGWLFDGEQLRALRVEPQPLSFATGCEDLVQAYRRELDQNMRLGRAVTELRAKEDGGFRVTLGGEVPTELESSEVVVAMSTIHAAHLLGHMEPELGDLAERATYTERAFVWLGCLSHEARDLHGYGVLPHPELDASLSEIIYCTNVFPRRAMPERFLMRCETAMEHLPQDDGDLLRIVTEEVRRWTGIKTKFGFDKIHRFRTPNADGTQAECETRIRELVNRVPGLSLA